MAASSLFTLLMCMSAFMWQSAEVSTSGAQPCQCSLAWLLPPWRWKPRIRFDLHHSRSTAYLFIIGKSTEGGSRHIGFSVWHADQVPLNSVSLMARIQYHGHFSAVVKCACCTVTKRACCAISGKWTCCALAKWACCAKCSTNSSGVDTYAQAAQSLSGLSLRC